MRNTKNARVGQAKNVRESSKLKRRIIKHGELAVIDREKKDCTRDDIWIELKELERTIKGL
ncbi:14336_t:CDS:2, partial [Gigaspora margarita]